MTHAREVGDAPDWELDVTDHLKRIREHMALETDSLLLQAKRARLFDNTTNRGSEAEHGIVRWLRSRFAPSYTVSSGEIIDSFDTNGSIKSRQQDGIVHQNDADANRFVLPSGMRLVPIETVAAVVEVKLTLSKEEFDRANRAADETSSLLLRANRAHSRLPVWPGEPFGKTVRGVHVPDPRLTEEQYATGVSLSEPRFRHPPITFALFAFLGDQKLGTIRDWMKGKTVSVVCSLESGCVARHFADGSSGATVEAAQADALWHFSETILQAIAHHGWVMRIFQPDFSGYASYEKAVV